MMGIRMYTGLSLMNAQELAEITRLIGVEVPPESPDVLFDIVSGWLARSVKREGRAQEEVERCVLEWTAHLWKIIVPDGTDTNDLERALRLKIANDALEFLTPGWALCCALIASGKRSNIGLKLDLMEEAAATAVPSSRARAAKREEWERLCSRWADGDSLGDLAPFLDAIRERPELHNECLSLGLALSLLDGSIGFPTERLYRGICEELDIGRGAADEIQKKVTDLYWKHHNAAQPTKSDEASKGDPVRMAAERTVYGAGALEALAAEARTELFASLEPEEKTKTGWSKFVGGLSGMSGFFSNKMKNNSLHATLARVVYHTILKQHDAVVVAARQAHQNLVGVLSPVEQQRPAPAPVVSSKPVEPVQAQPQAQPTAPPAVADAPPALPSVGLSDSMVDNSKPAPKSIRLDL